MKRAIEAGGKVVDRYDNNLVLTDGRREFNYDVYIGLEGSEVQIIVKRIVVMN